jgi:hypothetical protein
MAQITRAEIALRIGMSRQNLDAKIKHGWSDFPAPIKRVGKAFIYDEEIALFYCKEKMISDITKEKAKTGRKIGQIANKAVYKYNMPMLLNMRM